MKNTKFFTLFLIFIKTSLLQTTTFVEKTEFLLGTIFEIKIEKVKNDQKILDQTVEFIREMENKFSVFKRDSEVSKLNKLKKYKVSEDVLEVIKKAIEISKLTDGAFDITCKPLIDLYKLKSKKNQLPDEKEIKRVLKNIGWEKIKISEKEVILEKEMEIDLGGIAKGYIVDRVVEFLKNKGIKNGLVNAGGDIYCWGKNPEGEEWKIGIENPFKEGEIIAIFSITDRGIATSGNYKRFYKVKNLKIGHIVNPITGNIVFNSPVSVTVIGPNCTEADGLATGIFVLGVSKSLKLMNKLKNFEYFIIDRNGKIYMSPNFPVFQKSSGSNK
ncbi:MAG: FAD:protein FMN transferase [Candidatus Omnitrophica bacterium]|nr:FAD:protein FMN transferase [Candidatus Omnitrophota bacterium]MCM8806783.1 FAD:protein FMN transferase [Candidatus Omnitrophota bacterium]